MKASYELTSADISEYIDKVKNKLGIKVDNTCENIDGE